MASEPGFVAMTLATWELTRGHGAPVSRRLVSRALRAVRSHDTATNPASNHFSSRPAKSDRTVSAPVALTASRYQQLPEAWRRMAISVLPAVCWNNQV